MHTSLNFALLVPLTANNYFNFATLVEKDPLKIFCQCGYFFCSAVILRYNLIL